MNVERFSIVPDKDSAERQRDLLKLSLKYLCWLAVAAFVVSAALSVFTAGYLMPRDLKGVDRTHFYVAYFVVSVLANIAAAAAIYLVSYVATRKYTQFQIEALAQTLVVDPLLKRLSETNTVGITEYQSLWQVPWTEVIGGAQHTIDVCVQGWDGLVEIYKPGWVKFFQEKSGRVNLILPNIAAGNETIAHMANRMMKTVSDQIYEIRNTYTLLDGIQKEINSGKVQLYNIDPMIWYCLIRIDQKVAFLSFYEHVHDKVVDSAVFKVDLERYPRTKAWVEKELKGLMEPDEAPKKKMNAVNSEQRTKRKPEL